MRTETRREFIKGSLRWLLAAVIGITGGKLLADKRISFKASQVCISRGICRGCAVIARCCLPQALSARAVLAERRTRSKS